MSLHPAQLHFCTGCQKFSWQSRVYKIVGDRLPEVFLVTSSNDAKSQRFDTLPGTLSGRDPLQIANRFNLAQTLRTRAESHSNRPQRRRRGGAEHCHTVSQRGDGRDGAHDTLAATCMETARTNSSTANWYWPATMVWFGSRRTEPVCMRLVFSG